MKLMNIRRGDIFWVDFDPSKGTEIQKKRPALICSHDIMNENSKRVIVAPITSNIEKIYTFEYLITSSKSVQGKIMLDQLRSIDKLRLGNKEGSLTQKEIHEIDSALKFILGIQL